MSDVQDDQGYVEQLVEEYCGERIAGFPRACRIEIHRLFGDVMWHEGIEALTPARVDTIIAYATAHPTAEAA